MFAALHGLDAAAADISAINRDGVARGILVVGAIISGDRQKFANIALTTDRAVVILHSEGGNIREAFEIGRAIRLKGFATYVVANDVCASACALIWLSGTPRQMSANAKIGFHAAYLDNDGTKEVSSSGNAVVGSYLNSLGLPEPAIAELTAASPDDVQWVTPAQFARIGIDVQVRDYSSAPASQENPVESHVTEKEPSKPVEAQATSFLIQYLGFESAEPDRSVRLVAAAYANTVSHFGRVKTKQEVLAEFSRYVERWPSRSHTIKPGTLVISCPADQSQCTVDVLIDWDVSSAARNARSKGTSTWHLVLNRSGNEFSIALIGGKVQERHLSKLQSEPCFGPFCSSEEGEKSANARSE